MLGQGNVFQEAAVNSGALIPCETKDFCITLKSGWMTNNTELVSEVDFLISKMVEASQGQA